MGNTSSSSSLVDVDVDVAVAGDRFGIVDTVGTPPVGWSDLADPAGMATERLEAELVSHTAYETIGLARMLDLLAEYDRREGWGRWIGCVSLQHWLSWHCGLGPTAATERLRVARRLAELPEINRLFHQGVLSWSKVRALTRVATPVDDAVCAELASMLTAAQLERLAAIQRRVTAGDVIAQEAQRGLTSRVADDGGIVIELRLPADEAAPILAAIGQAAGPPERGVSTARRRADAAVKLLLGRAEVRTEVQVHIEQCPSCQRRTAATDDGVALHPDVADTMACNADLVTTHHHDQHPSHDRTVDEPPSPTGQPSTGNAGDGDVAEVHEIDRRRGPTKRQRRWLARRHPMCQFPGCHHTGSFDAHHVIAHPNGGPTKLWNLVRLCRAHHRIIHLARLLLVMDADRNLTITTPHGQPIDDQVLQVALRLPPPDDVTRIGGLGEHMDLDACLFAIHHPTTRLRPPSPTTPFQPPSPATATT